MKVQNKYKLLSHKILDLSNREISRISYLNEITDTMLTFSNCDFIKILLLEKDKYIAFSKSVDIKHLLNYRSLPTTLYTDKILIPVIHEKDLFDVIFEKILTAQDNNQDSDFTFEGTFYSETPELLNLKAEEYGMVKSLPGNNNSIRSCAIIPIKISGSVIGVLQLKSRKENTFSFEDIESYETFAETLGVSILHFLTKSYLHERVKELTCIYQINQIIVQSNISINEILNSIVKLIPPAWQYPEITEGRISIDNLIYETSSINYPYWKQEAEIFVKDKKRGAIEVFYKEMKPEFDEGPFLAEERSLINEIARKIGVIIEIKEEEETKIRLQEQLHHADRLALIGQLAAGVAHELNEPLGSILGFAQLALKSLNNPEQAAKDIDKIIKASLYSREIIRKLLTFAKETPKNISTVNINDVISESLMFFESRCTKAGIELIRDLAVNMPDVKGNSFQFNHILINLVVNSIQAMANGGQLIISTSFSDNYVCFAVEDNGIGMNDEIIENIFHPFFTTKDIDEGTGLGLAVVHGIVKSYNGKIKVKSAIGKGTKFEILFPRN
ncbi:MAG: Signal transduction histidine kinase [Ignavibacteria bacterium]|nr:Signal transduction histidine kinase [Ignavibacteria bacterium]